MFPVEPTGNRHRSTSAGTLIEWRKTPQFDSNELQLDLRPIIEKDVDRFAVVLNPKFEKAIFLGPNKKKGFEFGCACGVYFKWLRELSPGVEFYGGIGFIDDSEPSNNNSTTSSHCCRANYPRATNIAYVRALG